MDPDLVRNRGVTDVSPIRRYGTADVSPIRRYGTADVSPIRRYGTAQDCISRWVAHEESETSGRTRVEAAQRVLTDIGNTARTDADTGLRCHTEANPAAVSGRRSVQHGRFRSVLTAGEHTALRAGRTALPIIRGSDKTACRPYLRGQLRIHPGAHRHSNSSG